MKTRDPQFPPVLADIDSHAYAMSIATGSVVEQLTDLLGLTMVAAIGGVGETRAVQQWIAGREPQRPNVLRFALQLALMMVTQEDKNVARAWFQGSNPQLGDRTPIAILRTEPLEDVQGPLMAAARSFAARSFAAR